MNRNSGLTPGRLLALCGLLAGMVGCGDETGGSGAGGSSGDGSSAATGDATASTTGTGDASTTSTGAGSGASCEDLCAALQEQSTQLGCGTDADCLDDNCDVPEACAEEAAAAFGCAVDDLTSGAATCTCDDEDGETDAECDMPSCGSELGAYSTCLDATD
jgi:hypothetical protein